jgi:ketosteroid isomerase-like protein
MVCGGVLAHQGEDGSSRVANALGPDAQAVVDTLNRFATAFQSADIEVIHSLISGDGVFSHFEGAFADWSWDSYAGHLAEEMPLFSETQYKITNVHPETEGGMAFATYDWSMDVIVISEQFEGGRHPISMNGIATAVLVKSGDDWKIRHMHTARAKAVPAEH